MRPSGNAPAYYAQCRTGITQTHHWRSSSLPTVAPKQICRVVTYRGYKTQKLVCSQLQFVRPWANGSTSRSKINILEYERIQIADLRHLCPNPALPAAASSSSTAATLASTSELHSLGTNESTMLTLVKLKQTFCGPCDAGKAEVRLHLRDCFCWRLSNFNSTA